MRNNNASAPTGDGRQEEQPVDYHELLTVAARLHGFEAQRWEERLAAHPDDPDVRGEIADERRRFRDLITLRAALDALAAAVKQDRMCGARAHVRGGTIRCGDVLDDAPRYCEYHQAVINAAITQLLAGRGTR